MLRIALVALLACVGVTKADWQVTRYYQTDGSIVEVREYVPPPPPVIRQYYVPQTFVPRVAYETRTYSVPLAVPAPLYFVPLEVRPQRRYATPVRNFLFGR